MAFRSQISRLAWRLRWIALVRGLVAGLFWAVAASAVVIGVDRLIYLGVHPAAVVAVLASIGIVGAGIVVFVRNAVGELGAAVAADRALGLGDRLPSALQLGGGDDAWARAVVEDAEHRLEGVDARRVFPLSLPLHARLLAPGVIAVVVISLLPEADLLGRLQRKVEGVVTGAVEAGQVERALGGARDEGGSSGGAAAGIGGLRLQLEQIKAGVTAAPSDQYRVDVSGLLNRVASKLAEQGGSEELAKGMRETAEMLAKNDPAALARLAALEKELGRLQKAQEDMNQLAGEAALRAEQRKIELESRRPHGPAAVVSAAADQNLVAVTAAARRNGDELPAFNGVPISQMHTNVPPRDVIEMHGGDVKAAELSIERGEVPAGYVGLVRGYFSATEPRE